MLPFRKKKIFLNYTDTQSLYFVKEILISNQNLSAY